LSSLAYLIETVVLNAKDHLNPEGHCYRNSRG